MLASWSWLSFAALVLSICVWFVAPDMVDLLWVSAEVKRESVVHIFAFVVCGLCFRTDGRQINAKLMVGNHPPCLPVSARDVTLCTACDEISQTPFSSSR